MITPLRPQRRSGFTLLELIIATAIAGFMIFVFNQVFNEATRSVRRGLHTSDIISKARTVEEQLLKDTNLTIANTRVYGTNPPSWPPEYSGSRMLGPLGNSVDNLGGFLVIINHQLDAPLTPEDRRQNIGSSAKYGRSIRSDQLLFILDQDQQSTGLLPPITPAFQDTFGGDLDNSSNATYVRIWYGHALMTDSGGGDGSGSGTYDLGADVAGNPNVTASDWVLGRQALFLINPSETVTGDIYAINPTPFPVVNTTPSGAGVDAEVADYSGNRQLFEGVTDVTAETLWGLTEEVAANGAYLGLLSTFTTTPEQYRNRVLGLNSEPTSLIFNQVRLRVNPNPRGSDLEADEIAQMHPYLAGNISDFIVEWAGDLDNDLDPTTYPGPLATDGRIDMIDLDGDGVGDDIRWYSALPNTPGAVNHDPDMPPSYAPPSASSIPAYEMWSGAAAGAYANGGAFVWGHDGSALEPATIAWPWLIRIRYRVHDRNGEFVGRTINEGNVDQIQEPGRWFETIIPVNRQPQP